MQRLDAPATASRQLASPSGASCDSVPNTNTPASAIAVRTASVHAIRSQARPWCIV